MLGYTGAAYIGGQPTDQWIASQFIRDGKNGPPLGDYTFSSAGIGALSLNSFFWRLSEALKSVPKRSGYLAIMGTGYRLRRRRAVPFAIEVAIMAGSVRTTSSMRPPTHRLKQTLIAQIGDEFPGREALDHVAEGLKKAEGSPPKNYPSALVHAIRARADQSRTVGKDVMTVLIPHPFRGRKITWEFHPATPHRTELVSADGKRTLPFDAVYSPWILAPSLVVVPTIATMGFSVKVGAWTIGSENPAKAHEGPLHFVGTQPRKG